MSNYSQTTFFTPKDSLPANNPAKTIFGAAYDVEFAAISTAIATKPDNTTTASFLNVNVTGNTIPSNGIYLPSANTLGLASNGAQRITINNAGNVSVLTASSGTTLQVTGTGVQGALTVVGADNTAVMTVNATASTNGGWMALQSSGVTRGAFGIGSNTFTGAATQDVGIVSVGASVRIGTGALPASTTLLVTSAAIQGLGPTAAALVDMTPDTGTFTATLTGCTASPTGTCTWTRIGKLVTLYIPGISGTSNTTAATLTGLPAAIQPATLSPWVSCAGVQNNGATVAGGSVNLGAGSGTITLSAGAPGAAFTASGSKGIGANCAITYLLN